MALTPRGAREVAVAALGRRDLSTGALARRLLSAGADAETARETLDWLVAVGYVDDARLARTRAVALAGKGYGNAAIAARLEQEELGQVAREIAVAELEPEEERARRTGCQTAWDGPKALAALLARRGFCDDSIEAALAALDAQRDAELR